MQILIEEVSDENARRKGYVVEVESLQHAKETAVEKQCFQGTVLVIRDANTDEKLCVIDDYEHHQD